MKTTTILKQLLTPVIIVLFSISVFAQDDPANRPSPPATATGKVGVATITINYGSPSVKERKIWGELVPYGKVWRSGANEATTFETDKDIKVEGKVLPAGKYGFFTIPGEKEWVVIFNKVPDQWGAFKYDESQDALRVTVKPRKSEKSNERLLYTVNDKGIALFWENLEVPVAIQSR
ncbi:MAG: DUF2911 domain-containing protein [Chitinophagaceae bacterium]|nr:DUF2911 domain-containing protein [Chitinophagaceae bacterium]